MAVATEAFAEMGQDTARSLGLAGLPIVAAPNGFESLSRDAVRVAAEGLYEEVLSILCGDPQALEPTYASRVWLSAIDAIGVSCAITKAHAFG